MSDIYKPNEITEDGRLKALEKVAELSASRDYWRDQFFKRPEVIEMTSLLVSERLENFKSVIQKHYLQFGYEKQHYLKEELEKFFGCEFKTMYDVESENGKV